MNTPAAASATFRAGSLLVLGLLIGVAQPPARAQSLAVTHCQGPCPQYHSQLTARQSRIVVHHLYAAGLNGNTGLPDWSAYRLTPEAVGVASLLPRRWQPDRLVEFSPVDDLVDLGESAVRLSQIASNSNNPYAGAGAQLVEPEQRARLAPMTSFANTPYWSDLNNLSNMVPMPSELRRGAWLQLEQRLNRLVATGDELYVITGPLFIIDNLNLSAASARLNPAAYFKLVADADGVVAFVFPENLGQFEPFCELQAKVEDIQQMAGIDFYPDRDMPARSSMLLADLGCAD